MTLSTKPPRGTADRYPEEFCIRKYIFDTRRDVCRRFGYEEYLGPLVEDSAIWQAKSGEDVGGTELTLLTDRTGDISDLALRPEMTPTVTRMITQKRQELPKPVRRFSIANFYRNERPQRGRNREFRQLNVDMFGETHIAADIEILTMSLELMKSFGASAEQIALRINHRGLIELFLTQYVADTTALVRLLDKWDKLSSEVMSQSLQDLGIDAEQQKQIQDFMGAKTVDDITSFVGDMDDTTPMTELLQLIATLQDQGYGEYIQFSPSLMRGFDYYDGMVFEVFDKHPDNKRALFGGGRYNGLAEIFGAKESIPAVGFAPGDETMKLFLESWDLLKHIPKDAHASYYIPLLDENLYTKQLHIAHQLRAKGTNVLTGLTTQKLGKAFQTAQKQGSTHLVMVRADEVKIKELATGEETLFAEG